MHRYTLNVFKDMYYHELTTKESINSRVAVPLTALSIVVTLIVYYITNSEKLPVLPFTSFLLFLYYITTCFIIISVIYAATLLLRIFWGNRYVKSPSPKVIDDYIKQVEQSYAALPEDEKEIRIKQEIDSYLNDLYRDATDENSANNIRKIEYMRKANICIILAVILCILNAILLFFLNKIQC